MGPEPMKPLFGPFAKLLYSRKFLLLCLDVLVSAVLYFVGKYAGNSLFADTKFLIGILQPVVIAIILAIAHEDAAEKRNEQARG